ncbi:MAG: FKBP-type peptidyl-prolyl cis-trans isomerase [Lentisphaeria bacterium]|jgi:FKBP-type peptidyl-prolyl cis-trans isomerase FklB
MSIPLDTAERKTSYCLGLDIGTNLRRLPLKVDFEAFSQGAADIFAGTQPALGREEFQAVMQAFQQTLQQQAAKAHGDQAARNLQEGQAFLAENQGKPDVQVTASGLQYQTLEAGSGIQPSASDEVTVHYTGRLLDSTVFDSSVARGEPATFPLNGVIPGWTEGLQLMQVGGKARFFVPPQLAYGERGAGQAIGPNATLVFDVELLAVKA